MPPRKRPPSPVASGSGLAEKRQRRSNLSMADDNVDRGVDAEESMATEEDSEHDTLSLTQHRDFDYNPTMGMEAEVGIIEKVSLKNFMCHTRLEFDFSPQVNFIIGQNGSGKSAVLTSIVIGLGGKANVTNRGTSVKGFIKSGKQMAEVTVKLRNQGQDAYKPDVYGRSIIVERRLTREGATSYRLKGHDGKLVSTKREELNHILDSFNIQVDNPVAVLNQDCSRNFLHSKNTQDKYKFFLKATQLEQLKHDYVNATEAKEVAVEVLRQKRQGMPALELEVTELEEQYKASTAVGGLYDRVKLLKDEQAWAIIAKAEKDLEQSAKELRTEESRRPKFIGHVEKHTKELNDLKSERKELNSHIQQNCQEAKELETTHTEGKRNLGEAKVRYRNAQMEVRRTSSEYSGRSNEHKTILDRISEIKNTVQEDYEAERLLRERKITELEEMIATLNATHRTTEHELDQFQSTINKYKEDQYKLRSDDSDITRQLNGQKQQLRDHEAARQNRMKRFGHWMPDVLARIEEHHTKGRFHKKPRGPIGRYLDLSDQKWALAVESCLRSLIHAFAVHDHHDERELERIFSQVCPEGRKPATITSQFQDQRYDVSRFRPDTTKYSTVLEVLEINDPIVANCLIDQRGIENVLLIENNEEARKVMMYSPPRNVREAFTLVGDQVYSSVFRYYSNNTNKVNILTSSFEENIRACQDRIEQLMIERQKIQIQQRELSSSMASNQQQCKACETRLMKLKSQISKVNLDITELKEKEDPVPVNIATLEEEAERIDISIQALTEKKTQLEAQQMEAKADLDSKDEVFRNIDARLRHLADSIEPYKEKQAHIDNRIEEVEGYVTHYVKKKEDHEQKLEGLKSKYEKQKEKFEEDTVKATKFCPRIKTRRTAENIESEIRQIQKQITKQEKTKGNHEEIARKYYELKESYKNIMTEVNQLNNFLKELDVVMEHRHKQYFEFRKMIAVRVKYFFILMLSNRNYTGKLIFNHQKEMLTMSVTPNNTSTEGSKDMKSLSGGERSFATVCFILALWDAMESPFRCLDEFDVFMDLVNRRIATEMMLNVAAQQKGRQFIFLTPLELSQMKVANNIRVYRMPDPDRGQGILGFQPANAESRNGDDEN